MKSFIVNVYKNKKWITLGLSILYLLLFCFPLITVVKSYDETTYEVTYKTLPFVLYLPTSISHIPDYIKTFSNFTEYGITYKALAYNVSIDIFCSFFMLVSFILAIFCMIHLFKGKRFQFIWSIFFAFLTIVIKGIMLNSIPVGNEYKYSYSLYFYPTTYIFLILLILDIVYLCLERYYLHGGQEKQADRKAARQAKQEAEYKQSPEYRIEQLEKELQDLKSQVKSDEDKE